MRLYFANSIFSCFSAINFHYCVIEINENYIYRLLNHSGNIKLRNIVSKDNKTKITVQYHDKERVIALLEKLNINILDIQDGGTYTLLTRVPVVKAALLVSMIFILFMMINSLFIWNITVEGNYSYTAVQIRDFLDKIQIKEGIRKKVIDSDKIEKEIRRKYDDISWVCAEVKGTNLIIHIKENYMTEISVKEDKPYNIVANRDAVIRSVLVRKGKSMVKSGDKIKKGDVLISGIVDVFDEAEQKLFSKLCNADGDIIGETNLDYSDKLNMKYTIKEITKNKSIYLPSITGYKWFGIGDNNNQNIVYTERKVKAFGNYYLPFVIQNYKITSYEKREGEYTKEQAEKILNEHLVYKLSILEQKGYKIIQKNVKINKEKNSYILSGKIKCLEPLGKVSYINAEQIDEIESENQQLEETTSGAD